MTCMNSDGKMVDGCIMSKFQRGKLYFCSEEIKMGKIKTSARRRKFLGSIPRQAKKHSIRLKKGTGLRESNPREELLNEELIGRAIWECLKDGDSEGVIEVIRIYLEAVNKTQVAKETQIARSTMYHTLKSKNPTVKTLAKLVHACV